MEQLLEIPESRYLAARHPDLAGIDRTVLVLADLINRMTGLALGNAGVKTIPDDMHYRLFPEPEEDAGTLADFDVARFLRTGK